MNTLVAEPKRLPVLKSRILTHNLYCKYLPNFEVHKYPKVHDVKSLILWDSYAGGVIQVLGSFC